MRTLLIAICVGLAVAIVITEMARRRAPALRHDEKRKLPRKGGRRG
jgi:hypothetical protein